MHLPEEYRNYKLSTVNEIPIHFFSINSASNWDFESYFSQTHSNLNKYKNFKKIVKDYNDDLNLISQSKEVPNIIKEYAIHLLNKIKPSKAQLKTRATKKRRISSMGIIFNGPINGGTINATVNNSSDDKRIYEEQQNSVERFDEQESSANNQENLDEHEPSIGTEWLRFIKKHQLLFHPFSPVANNIIRSGDGISPRPYLDRSLYEKHMESHDVEQYTLPTVLCDHLDPAIDATDLVEFKKEIRKLSVLILKEEERAQNENECLEFLEEFLNQVHKMYTSPVKYNSNEDAFNQLYTWPYLGLIGRSVNTDECKGYFIQGQPVLQSMSRQLKEVGIFADKRSQYKSDGLVKLLNLKDLELLLLETSGHFENNDKVKISLDHHKGVYGILAMLKCIADEYSFASVAKFSQVKVFFLHAAETKLHLWSMRYQPDGLFDLWRELCLEVKPHFEDRAIFLPQLIKFCWNTKCLLEQAVKNIIDIKKEHQENSSKFRYNPESYTQLSSIVNPVIVKLTKEEDSTGMGDLGPMYSPPHH
ncbi:uncharacterized protein BX663DRAFT_500982 [Cokeromyces recurvatus]|uniref:uncharacterized protein n=1 Tax=Cokeromyces recurvatus TaxID=90255 RepID=UPI0022212517|nr:uncharacterized protein BX663DRAFT_500982 [Cokeromyces recurvatus]KAI7905809.1 hypothetical protein BX663DRAFT_500982 [Cokeromyces recurvatus]